MEKQIDEYIKSLSYDLPYAINITLYKHNYYDRTIIGQLKRKTKYLKVPNTNSFIVDIDDLVNLLNNSFNLELMELNTISENEIPKNLNSIYFIDKIIKNFKNLKYIKVNVSDKRLYSRMLATNTGQFIINFDFKIITSVIDFSEYISSKEEYDILNKILKDIGLINDDPFTIGKAYINTKSQMFITLLRLNESVYVNENDEVNTEIYNAEKFLEIFDLIFELVDIKVAQDDCKLVLITDYLN